MNNMTQFEEFVKEFNSIYGNNIYDFIEDFFDSSKNPLGLKLREDLDEQEYDSYGNEDSTLKRIFFAPKYDIFVEFSGTRQSHVGEEWEEMKEVKPTKKEITIYE